MMSRVGAGTLVTSVALVLLSLNTARADDPAADGSYYVRQESLSAGGSTVDMRIPTAASFARPLVVICPGWLSSVEIYGTIANHLASRGFAVAMYQTPDWWNTNTHSWANELQSCITDLLAQNQDPRSPIYGELDPNNVGILGHSYGGAAVTMLTGQDARVKCCVALAPVNQYNYAAVEASVAKTTAPYLAIVGSGDTYLCPDSYPKAFYASATNTVAKQFVEVTGGGHMMFLGTDQLGQIASRYYTSWLERFLMGKQDPKGWTTGVMAETQVNQGYLTQYECWESNAAPLSGSVLEQGSTGSDVVELQQKLSALGDYTGTVDGDFGPGTKKAVMAFQSANGLTADGVVGPATRQALGM
ncbi:MAG TPA: alpha/beta fold hydrolase [Planctomycetota bacterium]|nr:alpha/beta fold hydrolase [Planctomycetota bacterium]